MDFSIERNGGHHAHANLPQDTSALRRVARWLLLEGFADWLMSVGYARSPTCHHVRRLKLVLERIESIAPDANFSIHQLDTIFTSVRTRPRYRATRRAFERFLAARRLLTVKPDVDRFAPLLKEYRHHLIEVRGFGAPTVSQHISTIADFLAQSLPHEAALVVLSAPAVEQFVITKGQLRVGLPREHHYVARQQGGRASDRNVFS